jgi:hypothetical protein
MIRSVYEALMPFFLLSVLVLVPALHVLNGLSCRLDGVRLNVGLLALQPSQL